MKMGNTALVMICIMVLQGCATLNWNDPAEVEKKIEVTHDNFTKVTSITGPMYGTGYDWNTRSSHRVSLTASKSETGLVSFSIVVLGMLDNWRFYNTAYDSTGIELVTIPVSRDVYLCSGSSCQLHEWLRLPISREYLTLNKDSGITFQVRGKNGKEELSIPSAYIQAFLSVAK